MNETGFWTIEAQSFGTLHNLGPLEQASHDFWVIRRPDGTIFKELHGLAAKDSTPAGRCRLRYSVKID